MALVVVVGLVVKPSEHRPAAAPAVPSPMPAVPSPRTATDHGIFREATRLAGFTGSAQVLAADPARSRLLAVSTSYDLIVVDSGQARVVRRLTEIRPESIAVTDNAVWVVGFGRPSGQRLGRLDPRTLRVTPVGPPDPNVPQGASAQAGRETVWISYA